MKLQSKEKFIEQEQKKQLEFINELTSHLQDEYSLIRRAKHIGIYYDKKRKKELKKILASIEDIKRTIREYYNLQKVL